MEIEKILLVDDDEHILFLLSRALTRQGYQVSTAEDGLQGLKRLQSEGPFAVVLTDLMMPNLGGLELLKEARKLDPRMEGIILTAAGSIESAISAMRDAGAYDYLQKPLESLTQLVLVVERAIAHRRLVLEQAHMEEREKARARWLQALVENVREVILVVSADREITVANLEAERLLGRRDLVGCPIQEILPLRLLKMVGSWQRAGNEFPVEMELNWEDGTLQMVNLAPLPGQDGQQPGWMLVLRDITALRQAEELKTEAVSEAINQIRMPMARAMSVVVEMSMLSDQNEQLAQSLYRLNEHWRRIQEWGDELLQLNQLDAERNVALEQVDVAELLEGIKIHLKENPRWTAAGRPSLCLMGDWPLLKTNAEMLRALLSGLIDRAAARSPLGGSVVVRGKLIQDQLWIEVRDDGQASDDKDGLPMVEKGLFEAGYGQLLANLDLSRSKSVLTRLGGQLWMSGQGPRGSTVILCLPGVIQPEPA